MASSRTLGLVNLPIVCLNVDDYYNPFLDMLKRAYNDDLLYSKPDDIIHFEPTSALALQWIEVELSKRSNNTCNIEKISDNEPKFNTLEGNLDSN